MSERVYVHVAKQKGRKQVWVVQPFDSDGRLACCRFHFWDDQRDGGDRGEQELVSKLAAQFVAVGRTETEAKPYADEAIRGYRYWRDRKDAHTTTR